MLENYDKDLQAEITKAVCEKIAGRGDDYEISVPEFIATMLHASHTAICFLHSEIDEGDTKADRMAKYLAAWDCILRVSGEIKEEIDIIAKKISDDPTVLDDKEGMA